MDKIRELTRDIFDIFIKHKASNEDGIMALIASLQVSLLDSGLDRKAAIEFFAKVWDVVEDGLKKQGRR